jgi:lysophospholipase L1-like esterase
VMPSPSPPSYHAAVRVFYDENGDGARGGSEVAVVPDATVSIAGETGVSASANGYATMDGVPAGSYPVLLTKLPPFYAQAETTTLTVPQPAGVEVYVPAVLPIGGNLPGTYMAFGDSITEGDGSTDGEGYRSLLEPRLDGHFGEGSIIDAAAPGTRTNYGARRIDSALRSVQPAYVLILYGTNDWNERACRDAFPCYTVDSLRSMVRSAKAHHTLPVLSTIIPCNTGFDARTPPERNVWVSDMNDLIRPMAQQEGALLVDMFAAFMAVPDFHTLFSDHVHPNDAGYQLMTDTWFKAITQPPAATTSGEGEVIPFASPNVLESPRPPGSYGDPGREMGPNEE